MNCSEESANTISQYGISHELLAGKEYVDTARSDLMNVVIIRLPEEEKADKAKNPPSQLHTLLSTLFSKELPIEDRLERLQGLGLRVTEKIGKEVTDMCNLSQGIRNDGRVLELAGLVHDGLLDENVAASRAANYGVNRDDFREMVKNYKPEPEKDGVLA